MAINRDENEKKKTIMVAEDEPKIARLLVDYLQSFGYGTRHVSEGLEVVPAVKRENPDLLLLDIMLPGQDGMDICRELRGFTQLPIIMVTARVEEIDRILGLELGADDYICKPFSPREVVARVKTVLRRGTPREKEAGNGGPFQLDEALRRISIHGQALSLTPNEYHLLKALLDHPGRVFSRDQLLDRLYEDFREVTDRTIDSHIKNLRKKIARVLPGREVICSVYGVGYKLEI